MLTSALALVRVRATRRPGTSALSCGHRLSHSAALLSSCPPTRFGPSSFESGHAGLVPPPGWSSDRFPARCAPRDTCARPRCAPGHTLPSLRAVPARVGGVLSPENHLAMLAMSLRAEKTWINHHTAGTGPAPLGSLVGTGLFPVRSGATEPACAALYRELLQPIGWCPHVRPAAHGV